MTSSPEADVVADEAGRTEPVGAAAPPPGREPIDELPPALPSMWRLCRLGYRYEPALMVVALGLSLVAAVPEALVAFWLKVLTDGLLGGHGTPVSVAAAGLAFSGVATWYLGIISTRLQRRFRDRVTIALEAHVARLQASVATVAHQERREYLDRLSVLRDQVFVLDHMYMSLFTTIGWILRLTVTIVLLMSIHPALAVLALLAAPTVLTSSWRPAVERRVEERGAPHSRLARHLYVTATTAAPGKEVRVSGIGDRLVSERRRAWERWHRPLSRVRWVSAWWHAAAWTVFGAGYVGAVVFVSAVLRGSPGEVVLVLVAGSQLSRYVAATVGEIGFLRGIWMDGSQRLAWLEDYAARVAGRGDAPVPRRLTRGIELQAVSFAYPGSDALALRDVSLTLPAGAVVAIVGENGAGKTTLVKLLSKFYEPSAGRVLVDGVDLAAMPADQWRTRLSGAYQDFFRFELLAGQSIGVGDVPRLDDQPAVLGAVERAGADDVVARLEAGLGTQLGRAWPEGVDISFGQWQKLALARGFMREEPLLLVLDEPTAALDAETEHALFERYTAAARRSASGNGRIVILVSHRFSTVRMADLIVVLDGSRVAQVGSHDKLMAAGGIYAELYGIQAAAYR
jgi:ATP-binding cassette, subfamily B, bacterial